MKITDEIRQEVISLHQSGSSMYEVSRSTGVAYSTVYVIINGKRKQKHDWKKYYSKQSHCESMRRYRLKNK